MRDINFYLLDSEMEIFLYNFFIQTLERGKKSMFYSSNKERLEKLDNYLWTCKKIDFLPHCLCGEKCEKDTPIVLTDKLENPNNANFLFLESFLDNDFINSFEKIFYIVPVSNEKLLQSAKDAHRDYLKNSENKVKIFKKDNSARWVEVPAIAI